MQIAGTDDKASARLQRFGSPTDVWTSYRALEQRLSSGEYKRAAPAADAKPEDVAAWRKDNGVPEKPEGYFDGLPEGVVIGEDDKKFVGVFAEAMHAEHTSAQAFGKTMAAYYKIQEMVHEEQAQSDANAKASTEDTLRAEWGGDFRRNITAINNWLGSSMDADTSALFASARLADGTPVFSHPKLVQAFFRAAMEANPAATLVPGAGASAGKGIDERIGEIETMMRKDRRGYDRDEKVQAEYRQLIDARETMKARAA